METKKVTNVVNQYFLLIDISILMILFWYIIFVFSEMGYDSIIQISIVLYSIISILILYNVKYSSIFSKNQIIIDDRLYISRLRKIVYRQRKNYFIGLFISLLVIIIFSLIIVKESKFDYSLVVCVLFLSSIIITLLMYGLTTKKFIRMTNSKHFKNYKIYREEYFRSQQDLEVHFIRDIWRKQYNTLNINNKNINEDVKYATKYTYLIFQPYLEYSEVIYLANCVQSLIKNKDIEYENPIIFKFKNNQLLQKDIFRYAWNIYKYFPSPNIKSKEYKEKIAFFLKEVFRDMFNEYGLEVLISKIDRHKNDKNVSICSFKTKDELLRLLNDLN